MPLNSELHRDSHDLSVFIASQGAQTLGVVAGLLGLASGLYIVLGWHSCTDVGFVPWLAMALMATVFALLQFSRFRAALWLLLWGAVMVSLLGGIRRSGFDSPALMALPVLVTTGGWLLGRRQAMWMLA